MASPVSVLSSKTLPRDERAISDAAKEQVRATQQRAVEYLGAALGDVARPLTGTSLTVFRKCFLQEPAQDNLTKVSRVLTLTRTGLQAAHTIKLSASPYVKKRWGVFGEYGAIHLSKDEYVPDDSGRLTMLDARAWVYVHEATHKFADTEDAGGGGWKLLTDAPSEICYLNRAEALTRHTIVYKGAGLTAAQTLNNADSYAAFAIMVGRTKNPHLHCVPR